MERAINGEIPDTEVGDVGFSISTDFQTRVGGGLGAVGGDCGLDIGGVCGRLHAATDASCSATPERT